MKTILKLALSIFIPFCPVIAQAQAWSGVLAPARAINWANAGVIGGIPATYTQCGATIAAYGSSGTPASPATINSAIAACAPGTYVQLGSGTFYLNAGIVENSYNSHGVMVKGAGANSTFIEFYGSDNCQGIYANVCFESGDINWNGGPSNLTTWTASSYGVGTTTISLAAVPNLKVGNPIILDQLDDPTPNDTVLVCAQNSTSPYCSGQGNSGGPERPYGCSTNCNNEAQIVVVSQCDGISTVGHACSSGANITISPGLYMPNWSASKSPSAWWASNPLIGGGIEDVSIDATNDIGSKGIAFFNVLNGWVKGVRSIVAQRSHVFKEYTSHVSVVNSYMYLTANAATQSYGVESFGSSDGLTENNVCQLVVTCENENGFSEGDVIDYNFSVYNYFTLSAGYLLESTAAHTAGVDMVLYEGNAGSLFVGDIIHGSHNFLTMFRNYFPGNQPVCWGGGSGFASTEPCNNNLNPMQLQTYSHFMNVIGNILGQTGIQSNYTGCSGGIGTSPVYSLGCGYSDGVSGITIPSDANVALTSMRWGNCDVVTGFSSGACKFSSSEVPTSGTLNPDQQPYANSVPGSHTLPASFYYSSKPSWWPSAKAWPVAGPDVTGGNISGTGGLANTNPAQDCYNSLTGSQTNGVSAVLPFDESTCYSNAIPPQQAASPSCSPGTGSYTGTQSVSCTFSSPGSFGCYTTNGTNPGSDGNLACPSGTKYSGPISVSASETLKIIAGGSGYTDSAVVSYVYTISGPPTAATPTCIPVGGIFTGTQTVNCSVTGGAPTIVYTTDNSTPVISPLNGTVYTTALTISATTTLKLIAGGTGFTPGAVQAYVYTITLPPAGTPVCTPVGGTYPQPQTVSCSVGVGTTMRYTTNGTTPSVSGSVGTLYTGPITVSSTEVLNIVAGDGSHIDGSVAFYAYTITQPNNGAPWPLIASTISGTHTSCAPCLLAQYCVCNASDGIWMAVNGSQYAQLGTQGVILNGINKKGQNPSFTISGKGVTVK